MRKLGRTILMAVVASGLLVFPASAATVASGSNATMEDSDETVEDYEDTDITMDEIFDGVDKETVVTCERSASFTVVIPKHITLNGARGEKNSADYLVTVRGDIPGDQTIKVVPDTGFKMSTAGKTDIDATVTQDKKNFSIDLDGMEELMNGVDTVGTVEVKKLSSGEWNGAFNFNISVSEGEVL